MVINFFGGSLLEGEKQRKGETKRMRQEREREWERQREREKEQMNDKERKNTWNNKLGLILEKNVNDGIPKPKTLPYFAKIF